MKLDLEKLSSAVARQVKHCLTNDSTRADLFNHFMAEPDGKEVKFRSKFMDSSVRDVVEAVHVEVMDVLAEGENLAEFSPVGPEDEAQAEQETEVVGHIVWQQNDGYNLFRAFTLEAMVEQMAYLSAGWEEREEVEIDVFQVADVDELTVILGQYQDDNYEITGVEETEGGMRVEVRCEKTHTDYRIKHFPQSEMRISGGWPSVSLKGCPFLGRVQPDWTEARARAFGFSADSIAKLQNSTEDEGMNARDSTRYHEEDDRPDDLLSIGEFYIKWSPDKGPERYWQVFASEDGKTILEWEDGKPAVKEVPDHPYIAGTPKPLYHRHAGMSVAEYAVDIKEVKTALWRSTLDNVYATQYARPVIGMSAGKEVFEDLQRPEHGWPIRVDRPESLRWDRPPPISDTTLPLMAQMTDLQESRTGATRYNQGLDSSSLNKTATGIQRIMNASQKRMLAVARAFKEVTIKELYMKVHADLRRGPGKALTMRLRGKWVEVDPRAWRKRSDITVSGTSDRDLKAQGLQYVAMFQEKLMASGVPELQRLVTPDKVYGTVEKTLGAYGYRSAQAFFNDPAKLPPPPPAPPPPPDPMMIQAGTERIKAMTDQQDKAGRARNEQIKLQVELLKLKLQDAKVTGDLENKAEELDIKRDALAAQDDRAREQAALGAATLNMDAQRRAIEAENPNPEIAQ